MSVTYDLVIIGGGSAGLVVASAAAQLKAKVALVERDRLGGDCLWFGCIPSKSLIHVSRMAYEVKQAEKFGIYAQDINVNFTEVINHVQKTIATIQPHDSPERFRGLGVDVIFGDGQFIDEKTFLVNEQKLTARAFVISTGSRPTIPEIPGLSTVGYLTNEQVFNLPEIPSSLAVIGGGPIGCELGQAFSRLGAKVTMFISSDRLLPKEEVSASVVIEQQFLSEGINIIKNTRPNHIEFSEQSKVIFYKDQQIATSEILIATGRTPNIESLNLERAGVQVTTQGIKVNDKLQTTNKRIYACGDVIGGYQFTHVAGYEASVVLKNALFFPMTKTNYRVIPWATFTDPEVARVGLTEAEARTKYGDHICILQQDFKDSDRAQTTSAIQGFAKIITKSNGEILGAHFVGKNTGELIHEVVLAMTYNLPVSALTNIIHIYPTLAEINSKTSLQLTKQKYAQNHLLQNLLSKFFAFRRSL
jgi:pyruvate/2-oxoglutarate dehydrogenase complex dihydrolipoamide dehydrogenase (E3) component